ncbi:MAG: ferredoxin [Acidimicrobiales bacterium]
MAVRRRSGSFVLKVNPILCDGFGHCHELAPELVSMDEWGYPIIVTTPTTSQNQGALESAKYAVRGCPRQALRIERIAEAAKDGRRKP